MIRILLGFFSISTLALSLVSHITHIYIFLFIETFWRLSWVWVSEMMVYLHTVNNLIGVLELFRSHTHKMRWQICDRIKIAHNRINKNVFPLYSCWKNLNDFELIKSVDVSSVRLLICNWHKTVCTQAPFDDSSTHMGNHLKWINR